MKNRKTFVAVLILGLIMVAGLLVYASYSKNKNIAPMDTAVVYDNSTYGFTFDLPVTWEGYTVVEQTWEGNPLNDTQADVSGPKLLVRNPQWTAGLPYEDIPILVFTLGQWDAYTAEDFAVSAAPIPATELGRNNAYVFALPARWDFDYSEGYEEAQHIVGRDPLQGYAVEVVQALIEDGRRCYAFNHEATDTEPYAVSEFLDMVVTDTDVSGTKRGTQAGPDMTNGYEGTIEGTVADDMITSVFSYVVEGSANQEQELYKAKADLTGLEKLRYPLIDQDGMLVPDTTQEFQSLFYARVPCEASN